LKEVEEQRDEGSWIMEQNLEHL